MKRVRGPLLWATLWVGLALLAAACSSSVAPSIGQYGVVTGQGLFSNQTIKDVVLPGQQLNVSTGDTEWYLPANSRNYVTSSAKNADRSLAQAQAVLTAAATGTNASPGMSVKVSTYVAFELNTNHSGVCGAYQPGCRSLETKAEQNSFGAMGHFMVFCLKYGCASQTAQDASAIENNARSSTPGWLHMLDEVFPTAIDNATRMAVHGFRPSLWTDQSQWTALGTDISKQMLPQLASLDGSRLNGGFDYFCGPGATTKVCPPPLVIVKGVWPTDPGVITAYNRSVSSVYAQQSGAKRLAAAKAVYGPDAYWALAVQDLASQCQSSHVPCTIYAGQPPVHP